MHRSSVHGCHFFKMQGAGNAAAASARISEVGSSDTEQAPDMDEGSRLPHIIQTKGVPVMPSYANAPCLHFSGPVRASEVAAKRLYSIWRQSSEVAPEVGGSL